MVLEVASTTAKCHFVFCSHMSLFLMNHGITIAFSQIAYSAVALPAPAEANR